jgi:hypothetical protein
MFVIELQEEPFRAETEKESSPFVSDVNIVVFTSFVTVSGAV